MDIRYAWILWINRDERGFSSGGTYRDPRTGEILGSKTRMDSHRIRTIGNYCESYTPTTGTRGDDAGFDCGMVLPVPEEVLALASQAGANMPEAQRELALRRQSLLTTHELGHVHGLWPQLGVEHQRSRVGDGISDAAREGDAEPARPERGVRAEHRRLRRLHDPLRLHRAPTRQERPPA